MGLGRRRVANRKKLPGPSPTPLKWGRRGPGTAVHARAYNRARLQLRTKVITQVVHRLPFQAESALGPSPTPLYLGRRGPDKSSDSSDSSDPHAAVIKWRHGVQRRRGRRMWAIDEGGALSNPTKPGSERAPVYSKCSERSVRLLALSDPTIPGSERAQIVPNSPIDSPR